MLQQFPYSKMAFNPRAQCDTIAPDRYDVLLSQRRRWINSTVHNLMELLLIKQMCGFCLFSMRFVVFIDLFSTIVQPAGIVYLMYLLGTIAYNYITLQPDRQLPLIALYLLAAVYGMQAIIFIIKREFQHIGWMVIYILAMPLFGFMLPVYAFWHMDDFSWGNTRTIVGEDGKKVEIVKEEDEFDINEIPMKTWEQYEMEVGEYMNTHVIGDTKVTSPAIQRKTYEYDENLIPSDAQIYAEVQKILSNADLTQISKKQVRMGLAKIFGMDMGGHKEYINRCVDMVLGEMGGHK